MASVRRRIGVGLVGVLALAPLVWAGTIDTAFIEQSWPAQSVRTYEVGRHAVRWRQRASRTGGIFAGVRFAVPLDRPTVWKLSNDYQDIGKVTPGVTAVRFLEQTPTRQVIQIDVKVLWKTVQLTFEVEQDPPKATRFRLVNKALGEYRGVCTFEEPTAPGQAGASAVTQVELATWLQPARPVPMGLLLYVERVTFMEAARSFMKQCEQYPLPVDKVTKKSP